MMNDKKNYTLRKLVKSYVYVENFNFVSITIFEKIDR